MKFTSGTIRSGSSQRANSIRMKRSAEVVVETEETVFLRARPQPVEGYCHGCCRQASMITPEQAACIAGVSTRAIYAQVESGRLHFAEVPDGPLLVCVESLSAVMGLDSGR
jgi:hypothetical protein